MSATTIPQPVRAAIYRAADLAEKALARQRRAGRIYAPLRDIAGVLRALERYDLTYPEVKPADIDIEPTPPR